MTSVWWEHKLFAECTSRMVSLADSAKGKFLVNGISRQEQIPKSPIGCIKVIERVKNARE